MGSTLSFAFGLILMTTSSSFDFNANLYNYEIVFERVPTESAHSADKIKFLEKSNIAYTIPLSCMMLAAGFSLKCRGVLGHIKFVSLGPT